MPTSRWSRKAESFLLTIRKVNNRNVRYALNPEGMQMLSEKIVPPEGEG
jgi:hypothetical protein